MTGRAFIAATGNGIVRASQGKSGYWSVIKIPEAGAVCCLALDPLNHARAYAGALGTSVLRSDDGGITWQSCGLGGHTIKALATSPLQPGLVYAGTKPARLFVSLDGGASWEELDGFRRIPWRWLWFSPAEKPFIGYVQAIALSPTDPERIAVGIEAGATVLSEDGGKTWTGHRRGALRDCHSLTFNHSHGNWLYEAGGTGGGAAFSRDGGRSWARPGKELDRHYGWAVAADPASPEVWYVSASPGPFQAHSESNAQAYIFRHDGAKWQRLAGGLPQPLSHMPYALVPDPVSPGWLYAGLGNGDIWFTSDHGEDWQRLSVSLGGITRALAVL